MLQEILAEKARSHYIELACGHYTTWESVQSWAHWQTDKNKLLCEVCWKWKPRQKKKIYHDPPEPLF